VDKFLKNGKKKNPLFTKKILNFIKLLVSALYGLLAIKDKLSTHVPLKVSSACIVSQSILSNKSL